MVKKKNKKTPKKTLFANAGDVRDVGLIPGSRRLLGGGHGTTLQYSCLENPHGQRSLAATVNGITQSWTRLKQLSMHTHTIYMQASSKAHAVPESILYEHRLHSERLT